MGSSTILFALLEHRVRKMSRMEGRGAPMIFAAVFTVQSKCDCKFYMTVCIFGSFFFLLGGDVTHSRIALPLNNGGNW